MIRSFSAKGNKLTTPSAPGLGAAAAMIQRADRASQRHDNAVEGRAQRRKRASERYRCSYSFGIKALGFESETHCMTESRTSESRWRISIPMPAGRFCCASGRCQRKIPDPYNRLALPSVNRNWNPIGTSSGRERLSRTNIPPRPKLSARWSKASGREGYLFSMRAFNRRVRGLTRVPEAASRNAFNCLPQFIPVDWLA